MAAKKTNWSSCNLIEPAIEGSRLWQFSASSKKVRLSGDLRVPENEGPPAKVVSKTWTDIFSKKMNIATIPAEKVFLRVVILPECEPEELLPMLEFQIEELSPLPLAQVVWSAERVPGVNNDNGNQTVIIMIASRDTVESRLTELEPLGFLADRVEVPTLREFFAIESRNDGAHIQLIQGEDSVLALISWWFDGQLRDVNSFNLPDQEGSQDALVEKINRVTWAGEVSGWMPSDVTCYLAKRGDVSADWQAILARCFGDRIREVEPMSEVDLATATAEYSTKSAAPGLMLEDYTKRYRQRFQDSLWMQGIKGVVLMLLLGLVFYFGYGNYLQSNLDDLVIQAKREGNKYTNALALKARMETLDKRDKLKVAALKAWDKISIELPQELKFTELTFTSDRTLSGKTSRQLRIRGSADTGAKSLIFNYQEALTRMEDENGNALFSEVSSDGTREDPRKKQLTWALTCNFDGE
ncbi:MAG: hypothetical protein CMO57_07450 [Verrucomicrobiales bacterium]|nr:hypothetical protein [Verrucomicrobiales bacterium]